MSEDKTYRLIKGSEANSILAAIFRELTKEQEIHVLKKLISRTGYIKSYKANLIKELEKEAVENANFVKIIRLDKAIELINKTN